jgi:hypothetical protein
MFDDWYAKFLKLTKNTPPDEHKIVIQSMKRLILSNGEEKIVYNQTDIKQDPLGNPKRFSRANMGCYDQLVPQWNIEVDPENGYAKKKALSATKQSETLFQVLIASLPGGHP